MVAAPSRHPAERAWRMLPACPVRLPVGIAMRPAREAPAWIETGTHGQPFDFGAHVRRLCDDIALRCPELAHIDADRVLFAVTQARSGARHGLQARLTPLRFRGGTIHGRRGGVAYRVQSYTVDGREMLYLLSCCLPRFQCQSFDEKLVTLFHELYHISPGFKGDLRRLDGRCALHSRSKRAYDARMAALARAYLRQGPDPALTGFLRLDFAQLLSRHGSVVGAVVPRPRMVPVREE